MLFDDKKRNYLGRRLEGETFYEYLNRSGRNMCNDIRTLMTDWLLKYPDKEKNILLNKLKSKNETDFLSSFFELYLHNLMYCLGAETIIVHPSVASSDSKPDFFVKFPNQQEFYLEARIIYKSNDAASEEKLLGNLFEKINETLKGGKFLLGVKTRGKLKRSPPIKKISLELKKWTESLDHRAVVNAAQSGDENKITKNFNVNDWEIDFTAIPLSEGKTVKDQAIGIISSCGWGDNFEVLVDKVGKKSSKYGKLDKSLVLAINVTSHRGIEYYDIFQALFGQEVVYVDATTHQTRWDRLPNGLWTKPNCQHTRMSAILVTGGLNPASMIERDLELIPHPFAEIPLPESPLLKLNHWTYVSDRLVKMIGTPVYKLLEFPEQWID